MKKNAVQITDFSAKNIPVINRQLRDIWNTLGKVDYEEVSSASTAPNGGSHGDIKLLNDGTNKVLWVNIEGIWSNIGSLISSIVDHTHSSVSGQGGQLDWDNVWSDAVHTHQSNAEGGTIKLDDWATPDDNTDLNVSTTAHGLTPKLPNDNTKFLDGTGNYDIPVHSELSGTHNLTTDIDHNSLTNYDANQHKDTTGWDADLIPDADNTRDLGITTTGRWKDLYLAGNLKDDTNIASVANIKTAYDHSQDNTQAHSDYLLNNANDATSGELTVGSLVTNGNITLGSNWISNTGGNAGIKIDGSDLVGINATPSGTHNFEVSGTCKFGSGADYTEIGSNAILKLYGNAIAYDSIFIPISSMIRSTDYPPALTGHQAGYSFGFDASTDEIVSFRIQLPGSYKEASNIVPYLCWSPPDANSGNVVWTMEYSWANIDDAFPSATTINLTTAADGTANKNQYDAYSAISGTGKEVYSVIEVVFYRDANNASDTYASDALLHGIGFHFQKDTIGSSLITTK